MSNEPFSFPDNPAPARPDIANKAATLAFDVLKTHTGSVASADALRVAEIMIFNTVYDAENQWLCPHCLASAWAQMMQNMAKSIDTMMQAAEEGEEMPEPPTHTVQ